MSQASPGGNGFAPQDDGGSGGTVKAFYVCNFETNDTSRVWIPFNSIHETYSPTDERASFSPRYAGEFLGATVRTSLAPGDVTIGLHKDQAVAPAATVQELAMPSGTPATHFDFSGEAGRFLDALTPAGFSYQATQVAGTGLVQVELEIDWTVP